MLVDVVVWLLIAPIVCLSIDLNVWEISILAIGWYFRRRLFDRAWTRPVSRVLNILSLRPFYAIAFTAALVLLVRLSLLPVHPIPAPAITDEFSHLLLADTFHHGRWTNPTHPLWTHFESIHIIHRPTYNSMYFPGQGALLAVGMLLGHPWVAVLLSGAALCGAVVWALGAWVPQRWALIGGLIAVLRFGIASYWVNSYWGGALGAFGGCLVAGAFGRLRKRPSYPQGLILGVGLAILASVRPLEGALFGGVVAVSFLWEFGSPIRWPPATWRAAISVVLVTAAGVGAIGYHFRQVTGDALTMPYAINRNTYGWPMTLPWQQIVKVEHRHREMRQYFEWERAELEKKNSPLAFVANYPYVLTGLWSFFLGPALTLPLLLTRRGWRDARIRPLLLWGAVVFVIGSLEMAYPHYISPATICLLALSLQSLRWLRVRNRATREGLVLYRLTLASVAAVACIGFATPPRQYEAARKKPSFLSWCCLSDAGRARADAAAAVAAQPGRHVVFTAYKHDKFDSIEWVYNRADIDASQVIWARDLGPEKNAALMRYYPDRTFWTVNVDDPRPRPRPYEPAPSNYSKTSLPDKR